MQGGITSTTMLYGRSFVIQLPESLKSCLPLTARQNPICRNLIPDLCCLSSRPGPSLEATSGPLEMKWGSSLRAAAVMVKHSALLYVPSSISPIKRRLRSFPEHSLDSSLSSSSYKHLSSRLVIVHATLGSAKSEKGVRGSYCLAI